ncbi:MAG: CsgG/HfaB family protein [Planctomycetota bacterium]|jgi:hypothetical protein
MNLFRTLLLIVLFVAPACRQSEPAPAPMTDKEREVRVAELMEPVIEGLKTAIEERSAGITPFRKEGADYEPRVSRYLIPFILDRLVQEGTTVIERRDLEEVVKELELQLSDLVDEETTVEVGNISGVELLILGTVKDLTRSTYRIELKVVDLETAKILLTKQVDIPRNLLPIKYGGL